MEFKGILEDEPLNGEPPVIFLIQPRTFSLLGAKRHILKKAENGGKTW
jgi:hypothetical protein